MRLNLKHYSTLAAAFLVAKNETDAQIIYKDLGDVELTTQVFTIDLNNDSIPDFEIFAKDETEYNTYCSHVQRYISHRLINFAYDQEMGSSGKLYRLQCGSVVSAGKHWSSNNPITDFFWNGWNFANGHCSYDYPSSSSSGNWKSGEEGYIGLKFKIGTETHYGWIRVFIDSNHHMVLKDCAYESTTDKPIAAGALPCEKPALPAQIKACSGQGALIMVTNYSPCLNYQWYFNGRNMGAFLDSAQIDSSGEIFIVSNDGNGCIDTSDISSVSILNNPKIPVITRKGNTLISSHSSFYQWEQDYVPINGATDRQYQPQAPDDFYTVKITDINGCSASSKPDTFASCNLVRNLYYQVLPDFGLNGDYVKLPDTISLCAITDPFRNIATINAAYDPLYKYQWFENGTEIKGNSWFSTPIHAGQYYCEISGYGVECASDTVTVTDNLFVLPTVPTISRTGNTLQSSPATFYQWLAYNQFPLYGATSSTYTPRQNDIYVVEAIDSDGCNSFSDWYRFSSCDLVDKKLNLTDTIITCKGNTIPLVAEANSPAYGYYIYNWLNNDRSVFSSYSNSFNASTTGIYYCDISMLDSSSTKLVDCYTDSVYLLFEDVPTVTLNGNYLVSSSPKYNQWVKDGEIIPGANGQFYAPLSSGSYAVIVSPTDTCSVMSDYVYYTITSSPVILVENAPLISYVNRRLIQVKFFNDDFLSGRIKIINALGQQVREIVIDKNVMQIPFSGNETGWFVLDMEKDEHRFFSPVVIF